MENDEGYKYILHYLPKLSEKLISVYPIDYETNHVIELKQSHDPIFIELNSADDLDKLIKKIVLDKVKDAYIKDRVLVMADLKDISKDTIKNIAEFKQITEAAKKDLKTVIKQAKDAKKNPANKNLITAANDKKNKICTRMIPLYMIDAFLCERTNQEFKDFLCRKFGRGIVELSIKAIADLKWYFLVEKGDIRPEENVNSLEDAIIKFKKNPSHCNYLDSTRKSKSKDSINEMGYELYGLYGDTRDIKKLTKTDILVATIKSVYKMDESFTLEPIVRANKIFGLK